MNLGRVLKASDVQSRTENFIKELENFEDDAKVLQMRGELDDLRQQVNVLP